MVKASLIHISINMGVTQSPIRKALGTTKGDIVVYQGNANPKRLGVGSDNQVLTADSGETLGIKWATPSGGGFSSRARAYLSGSPQSIPDSTSTKIQLDTENFDELGEFDPVTNHRFTAQNAGYYLICGGVAYLNPVDGGSYVARIHKNGAEITGQSLIAAANNKHITPVCTDIVYLDAGDYLELYTWHDSGVAKDAYNNTRTFIAVHRIS